MGTLLVETEQDRSIRVDDLSEVVVGRSRVRQAKERLVPPKAPGHVSYANDGPRALHWLIPGLIPEGHRAYRPEPRDTPWGIAPSQYRGSLSNKGRTSFRPEPLR